MIRLILSIHDWRQKQSLLDRGSTFIINDNNL